MRYITGYVLILLALVVPACSSYDDDEGLPLESTVSAGEDNLFNPVEVRVPVGGSVTWDFGPVAHNVHFNALTPPADIEGENTSTQVTRTFPNPGTFNYACTLHPGQTGRVIVEDRPGYATSP